MTTTMFLAGPEPVIRRERVVGQIAVDASKTSVTRFLAKHQHLVQRVASFTRGYGKFQAVFDVYEGRGLMPCGLGELPYGYEPQDCHWLTINDVLIGSLAPTEETLIAAGVVLP